MRVLSILNKNYEILPFDYFDNETYVFEEACKIGGSEYATTVLNEFKVQKEHAYNKAYIKYLKETKNNPKLAIVEKARTRNGEIVCLTIFDTEIQVYQKYEQILNRTLEQKEKEMIYAHYKGAIKFMIDEYIYTGKVKGKRK